MAATLMVYLGAADNFDSAVAKLRFQFPDTRFSVKSGAHVAADLNDEQQEAIAAANTLWRVGPATYADASPPRHDLARLKQLSDDSGQGQS